MNGNVITRAFWQVFGNVRSSSALTEDQLVVDRDKFEDMVAAFRETHFAAEDSPSVARSERRAAKAESWRAAIVEAHASGWLSEYAVEEMLARNPYQEVAS